MCNYVHDSQTGAAMSSCKCEKGSCKINDLNQPDTRKQVETVALADTFINGQSVTLQQGGMPTSFAYEDISKNLILKGEEQLRANYQQLNTGANKDIAGKPRFDLIPPEVDLALAEVYGLGAKKYSDRNWELGIPYSVCIAALKRHLNAFEHGDMVNSKDGEQLHIEHALWWAAALVTFIRRNKSDLNDLPAYNKGTSNV